MSFVSVKFLFFLLILFPTYFLVGKLFPKYQWIVLLIASYIFYAFSNLKFVLFLLLSTFTTWYFALLTNKNKDKNKIYLYLCLLINIGLLFFTKYINFVLDIFNLDSIDWLIIPLGISFYTFNSVGYYIDVYREAIEPEKSFFKYALYVSFFPHISQGPLESYEKISKDLFRTNKFNYSNFVYGLERILLGMFKKVVIADNIGAIVNGVYGNLNNTYGLLVIIATICYAIQLYADFSGYMDIAIGVSRVMDIEVVENFNTPYFSMSIAEYWRRWHISLGAWFKNYIYYPILRSNWLIKLNNKLNNVVGKKITRKIITAIGLFLTWLLIGMWHGASLTFVLYGLYHGAIIVLSVVFEKEYKVSIKLLNINEESLLWKSFKIVRTFILVCFGYILFRAETLNSVCLVLSSIFNNFMKINPYETIKNINNFITDNDAILLGIALILIVVFEIIASKKGDIINWLDSQNIAIRWSLLYLILFFTLVYFFDSTGAGNFLYFKF